jgi:hypothetical protein
MRLIIENAVGGSENEVEVDVWPSDTIGVIKETVCQTLMVDPTITMLVYMGKPLDDSLTVAQLALPEGARLQMMLRYPGGIG